MINLSDYVSIVNSTVNAVCSVDEDLNFIFNPEFQRFYMNYYILKAINPDIEFIGEDGEVDSNKAFEYVVEHEDDIIQTAGNKMYEMIRDGVEKKILSYKERYYNVPATPSVCDVALKSLFETIEEKINNSGDIVDAIGKDNAVKLMQDLSKKKFTETNVVKAMKANGLV